MPLSFKASLYDYIHSSKISLLEDVSDIRFSIDSGNGLTMLLGWLECLFIQIGLLFSLQNGLYTFLSKSNVTSRKSTVFKLHCIVTYKPHPL